MKLNPLPFMFLPGMGLIGYFAGDWSGVAWSVAVWFGVAMIGSAIHATHHLDDDRLGPAKRHRHGATPLFGHRET